MGAEDPPGGELELLEVEQMDEPEGEEGIEQGGLPACEHIDRTGREALQPAFATRSLVELPWVGRHHGLEAAGGHRQVALQQGNHRAQVGRFRQPISPAPL